MKGTAKFNSKKTKRYFLSRSWSSKPIATWIMLNPSIADDKLNDKTINRCINFTKGWNYGGLNVVNLCSDINTKPFEILKKLKWKSSINFESALEQTFNWYLNNYKFFENFSKKKFIFF